MELFLAFKLSFRGIATNYESDGLTGRPIRLTIAKGALISAGDLVQVECVREIARKQLADRMQSLLFV